MKKTIFLLFLLKAISVYNQETPIHITTETVKLSFDQTKEIYYSFTKGDEIIFDFEMIKGKHLKELEIVSLPNQTLFSEYKVTRLNNKGITIKNKGVYKFRFYNSSLTNRIFKYSIKRVPISPKTKNFNTNWKWKTIRDTTYTRYQEDSLVGYIPKIIKKTKKQLVKIDTIFTNLLSKSERVHSETAIGKSQYSLINVYLPKNKYIPNAQHPYESIEVIAWSHWLGVGQQAKQDYNAVNDNISEGLNILGVVTGYEALSKLAITGISLFSNTNLGDNVHYKFMTQKNDDTYVFNNGNGTSDSGRNIELLQGGFTIELYNDNFTKGIDVDIKIIVAQIHKVWKDIPYEEEIQQPKFVTLDKIRMNVSENKIRIPVE